MVNLETPLFYSLVPLFKIAMVDDDLQTMKRLGPYTVCNVVYMGPSALLEPFQSAFNDHFFMHVLSDGNYGVPKTRPEIPYLGKTPSRNLSCVLCQPHLKAIQPENSCRVERR